MKIIYVTENGNLTIINPAPGIEIKDCISHVPEGTSYTILQDLEIPEDRYFRNAWEEVDGKIQININKAIDIQKNIIRKERENRLQLLDIEYLRAMEKNDVNELFKIASKKQLLRDATKSILFKKALSPEELKNISLDKILQDY